jgi:hypothetical protein
MTPHHEEREGHEGVNMEFDDLSNQVIGKAINFRRAVSSFYPLVSCLPFVLSVSFVVKKCFLTLHQEEHEAHESVNMEFDMNISSFIPSC